MTASCDRDPSWERRHLRFALGAAALCVAGLVLTWVMAELVPATRIRDAAALHGFIDLGRPRLSFLADRLLAMINLASSTLCVVVMAVVAVRRGRRRMAGVIPVVVGGSVGTSELLKPLLAHSHDWVVATHYVIDASWPSGHSAAIMSLVLCAVLVAPRRQRALVAGVGGIFAVAIGFALLTRAWHMPSDVIGGFLVAALWTAVAVAALLASEQRWPSSERRRITLSIGGGPEAARPARAASGRTRVALVAGAVLVLVMMTVLRPHAISDVAGHPSLTVAAAAIAALAAALVCGLTAGLRR